MKQGSKHAKSLKKLDDEQVITYLLQHPDFFIPEMPESWRRWLYIIQYTAVCILIRMAT